MKTIGYIITIAFTSLLIACGQDYKRPEQYNESRELVPDPEGYKEDTFMVAENTSSPKADCNYDKYLKDATVSGFAKTIFNNGDWNLDDEKILDFLDSLTAVDKQSRPFYFRVVTNSYKRSDGYYSEGLGLVGKKYVEKNTQEFLNYFDNNQCFTDKDLETWADIVMLEFSLADAEVCDKPFVDDYCKQLDRNCKHCSPGQQKTLDKFIKFLKMKWSDYVKKITSESKD